MAEHNRGSEWRRWDLHVHTRASYDYAYKGDDAEDLLVQAWSENKIIAVAITDHFCIDADRIKLLRSKAPNVTIFPGVELRTDKGAFNVHVILIFSDECCVDTLAADFDAIMLRGKAKNQGNNDKIYWDWNDILEFAKQRDGLISLHAGSKTDGVDDKITNALEISQAVKEEYAKDAHIFEIGKIKDVRDYHKKVFPYIKMIKPLVLCSDNHDPRAYYNEKTPLWIKADPTYNGLKQIVFEPDERVSISVSMPDYKPQYYVIDHILFNDDEFQTQPVFFNDKLTCIIGGKSTGKSILLHNLALSVDKQQVKDNEEVSTTTTKDVANLTTVWADGTSDDQRKIVYIPQTYLNRLSDEKESTTKIDSIIEDIILLNQEANSSHSMMLASIKSYKAELNKSFLDLIETHNELTSLSEQKKELGNKTSIETEITNLNKQKEKLSKDLSLSEDEINAYEQATKRISELTKQISSINSELSTINDYQSVVESIELDFFLSDKTRIMLDTAISASVEAADKAWAAAKAEIIKKLSEPLAVLEQELKTSQAIEATLRPKVQGNQAIAELADKIKAENEKLQQYINLDERCSITAKKENEIIENITASSEYFRLRHQDFANVVNGNSDLSSNELDFSVTVPFRRDDFIEKISSILSIGSRVFKQVINSEEFKPEDYTEEKLLGITKKLLSGELPTKGCNTVESALRDIFGDWYNTKYNVRMDNDDINVMSPGKKALVLLKLLIDLAESNCPILIDQPEDDLDNRSIFEDLIPFVRKKKRHRQIIVVTHNANVVLGADAEEIIVANQRGNNTPNKERRFEYRSGSIENDMPVYKADGTVDDGILNSQGIQQHICDILEGGARAFELRKQKYHI